MALRGGGKRGGRTRRRAGHADHLIAPRLASDPRQRVVAIRCVVGIHTVLAFGSVATARILIHRDVTASDDVFVTAQYRAAHRRVRAGQPAVAAIGVASAASGEARRDAVRCALQNHRKARPALLWQIDKRIELGTVTHSHHGLKHAHTIDCLHCRFPRWPVQKYSITTNTYILPRLHGCHYRFKRRNGRNHFFGGNRIRRAPRHCIGECLKLRRQRIHRLVGKTLGRFAVQPHH